MLIQALGLIALVALILVGALLPLKYTANMRLPKRRPSKSDSKSAE